MALREALELSEVILRNIELSEIPLSQIALKASRLARLLNDFDLQRIMEMEAGGYPMTLNTFALDVWALAVQAGRSFQAEDPKTKEVKRTHTPSRSRYFRNSSPQRRYA